jgi:hypothetical protein
MPPAAALLGIGLGGLLQAAHRSGRKSGTAAVALLVVSLLVSHIVAVRSKVRLMVDNGRRASMLLSQLEPFLPSVPSGGTLLLLNPPARGISYSIFGMEGFDVISCGEHRLNQLAGRDDFTVIRVPNSEWPRAFRENCGARACARVTLDPKTGKVFRYVGG